MEVKQLNDPTNSRYRYFGFKGDDMYRRFVRGDKNGNLESIFVLIKAALFHVKRN